MIDRANIQQVKQRFGIIGNSPKLNHALEIALQVAPTDLTVLLQGESGTGKEIFAQVIHYNSHRKHNTYIAVNCGAIPEGTIDSELFGHEKGAFTGAHESRKGYFEVADKGTIFLDEVAELPLSTQVRLLRVLETGEFIRVGSSKVQKTDVRVIAATNVNLLEAVQKGNFREDLYYRLSTVPIHIPPLRERGEDIYLLFLKFATDFAEKYHMPPLKLDAEAKKILLTYRWPGNVRQLKNVVEQMSIIEQSRVITADILKKYLPDYDKPNLPVLYDTWKESNDKTYATEREILFKFLFDMKKDIDDLKKTIHNLGGEIEETHKATSEALPQLYEQAHDIPVIEKVSDQSYHDDDTFVHHEPEPVEIEENLSLAEMEKKLIVRALEKHGGKRKPAAQDLGISERTLYRKIKEYNLDL